MTQRGRMPLGFGTIKKLGPDAQMKSDWSLVLGTKI